MHILLTGGCGYIGTMLTEALPGMVWLTQNCPGCRAEVDAIAAFARTQIDSPERQKFLAALAKDLKAHAASLLRTKPVYVLTGSVTATNGKRKLTVNFSNVSRIDLYIESRPLTSINAPTAPWNVDLPLSPWLE